MSGTLHLVPVPIGHRDDITLRALDVLRAVAVVAAEDTRDFRNLARHYDIRTRVVSYHDHNERSRTPELLERLQAGDDVALVTDAGTPLVSDPGYRLVRAAVDAGVRVTSLPGASAVTTALAGSGLSAVPFRFIGFPPRATGARRAAFEAVRADPATLVAFEAPHRLRDTLADALEVLGDRQAVLARNLTKPHERFQRGTLSSLLRALDEEDEVRGECTLLIAGAGAEAAVVGPDEEAAADDARLLLGGGASAASVTELLVRRHGLRRRQAYALVIRERDATR